MSAQAKTLEFRRQCPVPRWDGSDEDQALLNMRQRLSGLASLVDNISHSAHPREAAAVPGSCDFVYELRVKAEAVRCMLQVVEHLSGATRVDVLSTVTKSVQELEEVVCAELQARRKAAERSLVAVAGRAR
ncbi:MAG TPA: hypothetical protein VIH76_09640 [Candidatus Acidoferrales bacterium]